MLASILNSGRVIEMNIAVVRTFIYLRQIALEHKTLLENLSNSGTTFMHGWVNTIFS